MSQKQIRRAKLQGQTDIRLDNPGRPAGISKSRRIVKAEKDREIQFMKLCAQIRLDNYKTDRAEQQRNDRQLTRKSRNTN